MLIVFGCVSSGAKQGEGCASFSATRAMAGVAPQLFFLFCLLGWQSLAVVVAVRF